MPVDIRTITAAELHPWSVAARRGFLSPSEVDDSAQRRSLMPLDRMWGAFDRDRVVATLRSFPVELTMPGLALLTAGAVTQVTTTATHRRRGLAGQLISADLTACRDRGEPVSILIAAEWPIYGRWGYGPATELQTFSLDTRRTRVMRSTNLCLELVDVTEFRVAAAELYNRIRVQQVGEISRPDWFWDLDLGILHLAAKPEVPPGFHLLARDAAGGVKGAVRYRVDPTWDSMLPTGTLTVDMLFTSDVEADIAVWGYLASIDLITEIGAKDRPVDEILPWLLSDPRRARASNRHDFLWCRVLDVAAALSIRRYRVEGSVVLEITDPMGLAAGRFLLEGGPDGAQCVTSTRSADLTMPARTLGAILLGGNSLRQLARAGWTEEGSPGALETTDLMFSCSSAPWCSTWF